MDEELRIMNEELRIMPVRTEFIRAGPSDPVIRTEIMSSEFSILLIEYCPLPNTQLEKLC